MRFLFGVNKGKLNKSQKISFGIENKATFQAKNIISENQETKFDLIYQDKIYKIEASVEGIYNIYNILGVIGTLVSLGYQIEDINPILKQTPHEVIQPDTDT